MSREGRKGRKGKQGPIKRFQLRLDEVYVVLKKQDPRRKSQPQIADETLWERKYEGVGLASIVTSWTDPGEPENRLNSEFHRACADAGRVLGVVPFHRGRRDS
jgi:hypothetical protein